MATNPKCTARNRAGGPCGRYAITGGTVCPSHGGNAPQVRALAARRLEQRAAEAAVVTLGLPVDVTPTEALLDEVRWTAGHVAWLRTKVAELEVDDLSWGVTSEVEKGSGEFPGTDITREGKPSVWYELYARERDRLVKVCEATIRAGVEERKVRLAESQGALVAAVIGRVLDGMLAALLAAGAVEASLREAWAAAVPQVVPPALRAIGSAQ